MMDALPTVLIVDDEKLNRHALADLLGDLAVILLAKNAQQALQITLREPAPQLILLDVMMPGMDGYACLQQLREDPRTAHIPVIFVTGLSDEQDEERGLLLGAADYISKPFRPTIVRARVRKELELVRQRELLTYFAQSDPLLNIPNRRRFNELLEAEWQRAVTAQRSLSVGMLDVDYFKQFNDRYGHAAGDAALKHTVSAARSVLQRPHHLIGRYGGEEFAILLAHTDAEAGRVLAERVRAAVEAAAVEHADSPAQALTISFGGASIVPSNQQRPAELIEAADGALYEAKRNGRNQVAWRLL